MEIHEQFQREFGDLYPFASNYFDFNGQKMHYIDEGEGPVILCLHGNPTWSFYYRNLILELKKNYRVIVPDHIGCGFSDKPQRYEYTLKNRIDAIEALCNSLNLQDIRLCVHDWGGMIGFGYAKRHPQNINRFAILNTCAFRLPQINDFPLRIAVCRIPLLGRAAVRIFNGFARGATMMATVGQNMTKKEKEGLLWPYNSYKNRIATHEFVKDIPLNDSHPSWNTLVDIERNLHLFQNHPKLILWGMKDFCFDEHFLREWKAVYPGVETVEYPNAGHYVLEDAREDVINRIREFFSR